MTSAVKVDGERLYKRAHRGEQIETPEREVTVHRAELLSSGDGRASFEVECSSGTYIRTLIETLPDAYCESLRRTAIGEHRVPIAGAAVEVSAADLISHLPGRALSKEEGARVANGGALEEAGHPDGELVRLVDAEGLVAVARSDGRSLKPEVVVA